MLPPSIVVIAPVPLSMKAPLPLLNDTRPENPIPSVGEVPVAALVEADPVVSENNKSEK
jgi:hypothetical protein